MLKSNFQTGIWSGLVFRTSVHISTLLWIHICTCPVSRIEHFLVIHYCTILYFFCSLFCNDPRVFEGGGVRYRFHIELRILNFFYSMNFTKLQVCDDHHLLQTEVSGMRVKLCFNVRHRLRYY